MASFRQIYIYKKSTFSNEVLNCRLCAVRPTATGSSEQSDFLLLWFGGRSLCGVGRDRKRLQKTKKRGRTFVFSIFYILLDSL